MSVQKRHNIARCHCDACMDIKIGQMIMLSQGSTTYLDEQLIEDIKQYKIGGIVLFEHNITQPRGASNPMAAEQLRARHDSLQVIAGDGGIPLFISIDHEGGQVNRLRTAYGFPPTVSAGHLGQLSSRDSTLFWAAQSAQTLEKIGINLNYAPTLDLIIDSRNPISNRDRCFSSNADSVAIQGRWWIAEHHKRGVISAVKHFPGHGSSLGDSHKGVTEITATWHDRELVPYQKLIDNRYRGMIMVGHLFNQKLDSIYPSSLSKQTIQGLLRDRMGFQGVVITDALNMAAITDNYTLEQVIILAIDAGVDILMILQNKNHTIADATAIIHRGLANGMIDPKRIDQSFARIMKLKQHLK